ncbi:hypothetical protein N752_11450 [Desulforamulus aquiferis]|nr:hypothetical protein [Desulforamulus aquiferis]RYD04972.1 hypothetical protein N752_11450 [Desulforamulus aquiferis]
MAELVLNVSGMKDSTDQIQVINAMSKYSGVLDVAVEPNSSRVQVIYEKYNILPQDLKNSVESVGYQAEILKDS